MPHVANSAQASPTESDPIAFAGTLAELSLEWQQLNQDPQLRLTEIVAGAVGLVPGCEHAALVVYNGKNQLVAKAVSGPATAPMIAMQNELSEGPCRDTAALNVVFRAEDIQGDSRWSRFAVRAEQLGIGSMLCTPLMVGPRTYGSLSMASESINAFTPESEALAAIFAAHAAIALADAERQTTLQIAIDTRDLIGQAKGILMGRYGLTADQAFSVLVRESKNSNIKLRTISERLCETGRLPSQQSDPARLAP